jgi:hypothetical protein
MRRMVVVGLVGGAVVVTAVMISRRRVVPMVTGTPEWAPLRLVEPVGAPPVARPRPVPQETAAPTTAPQETAAPATPWVPPQSDGSCPDSHPVKANKARRIYHVPGGRYYDATHATRCFCDGDAAEADGYRAAKR